VGEEGWVVEGGLLSNQWGGGDINGPEQVGGEVGGVVAQASAPPFQPPQDRSNSSPAVAAGYRARRHAIAWAYALGIPIPDIIAETEE